MLNVYEQVSANKTKSTLILILFTVFIIGAAYLITYTFNLNGDFLIGATIFSFVSSFASYFWGDKIVLALNRAQKASRKEYFDFYTVTENLALSQQIPVPQIYVIDSPAPNAFATGRDPQHAIICTTTGLLEKLNRTELEGVIAHEISHIQNYDIRLMMLVSVLIGSISILTNITLHLRNDDDNKNRSSILTLAGFVLIIFAPIIAQLIQLAISRQREYLADASAIKITRQPDGLINALIKISSDQHILESASTATASLYIINPFKNNKLASLFSTHPPIEDRIHALKGML